MSFRDLMQEDIDAVFDADEMAVILRINDVDMVVHDIRTTAKKAGSEYGNYAMHQSNTRTKTLHIRETDMPSAPVSESIMYLGDEAWTVKDVDYALGVHVVNLEQNI